MLWQYNKQEQCKSSLRDRRINIKCYKKRGKFGLKEINFIQSQINNCNRCTGICGVRCGESPAIYAGTGQIKVMIIGHSPKTNSKSIPTTVLNMDKKNLSPVYRYITGSILEPLGLSEQEIYCTNLVKCFTKEKPEDKEKKCKGYITRVFANCSELLEREIAAINPSLIIGLSQRVLTELSSRCRCDSKKLKMEESVAILQKLNIMGKLYDFIPCVHLQIKNSKGYIKYIPKQTERLTKLSREINLRNDEMIWIHETQIQNTTVSDCRSKCGGGYFFVVRRKNNVVIILPSWQRWTDKLFISFFCHFSGGEGILEYK